MAGYHNNQFDTSGGESVRSLHHADGTIKVFEYSADELAGFGAVMKRMVRSVDPQLLQNPPSTLRRLFVLTHHFLRREKIYSVLRKVEMSTPTENCNSENREGNVNNFFNNVKCPYACNIVNKYTYCITVNESNYEKLVPL